MIFSIKQIQQINLFGHTRQGINYVLETRTIYDYELIYVHKGQMEAIIDNKSYIINEGDHLFIEPNIPHSLISNAKQIHFYFFHFGIESLTNHKNSDKTLEISLINDHKKTHASICQLFELALSLHGQYQVYNSPSNNSFLLGILISVLSLISEDYNQNISYFPRIAGLIRVYIENNINSKISKKDMALYFGYSIQHLNRICNKAYGASLSHYINSLKILHSTKLLVSTNMTISEISDELAFSNPYYFSKVFKQKMFISPSVYRKNTKKDIR